MVRTFGDVGGVCVVNGGDVEARSWCALGPPPFFEKRKIGMCVRWVVLGCGACGFCENWGCVFRCSVWLVSLLA